MDDTTNALHLHRHSHLLNQGGVPTPPSPTACENRYTPPTRFHAGVRRASAVLLWLLVATASSGCFLENDEAPVKPAIEHVWLEGVSGGTVAPHDSIHVKVTGRGIVGETIVIEVYGTFESSGESLLLESWEETVVYSNNYQRADVDFVVAGEILDHEDEVTITFHARFEDQVMISDPLLLVVDPVIQAVRVYYEGPHGATERGENSAFPITQELTVLIESMGVTDRPLIVEVLHSVDDETTLIDTLDGLVESQQHELTYLVDAELCTGEDGAPITFDVSIDDLAMSSPRVIGSETGIHSCGWYDQDGDPIGAEARVEDWTPVKLRAYTWGLDGAEATFEVWDEDELSNHDFAERLVGTVEHGLAEVEWLLHGIGDGPLDNDNEYYVVVQIGSLTCRSSRIITQ